jgi:AraC-like DNA-binding protein
LVVKLHTPLRFENLFFQILACNQKPSIPARLQCKALFLELLGFVLDEVSKEDLPTRTEHEQLVNRATGILRAHVEKRVSLPNLSRKLSVSRSLLCKVFHQQLGVSPMKYLMRMKMERAQIELALHRKTIKDTASMLGFDSVHHFTRVFRHYTGSSPGHFQKTASVHLAE